MRRPLGRVGDDDRAPVHIRLDLAPQGRVGPAAGDADAARLDPHPADDVEDLAHREGDALDDGADEVGAGVARGEADPSAAGLWVRVWAAFAGEVGEEDEAAGAGRGFGGVGHELVVTDAGKEGIAAPFEGTAGAEHAAGDAPG